MSYISFKANKSCFLVQALLPGGFPFHQFIIMFCSGNLTNSNSNLKKELNNVCLLLWREASCIKMIVSLNNIFVYCSAVNSAFCFHVSQQMPEIDCNMPYSGNAYQICSGSWRNSIYILE